MARKQRDRTSATAQEAWNNRSGSAGAESIRMTDAQEMLAPPLPRFEPPRSVPVASARITFAVEIYFQES